MRVLIVKYIHQPCCNFLTVDLLKLVYNKVAAICSRQVVTFLLTPVLMRLVTTTCNKSANNARITRDSLTMLQLVNSGLVTACLQQCCSNLLATSSILANDSIAAVYHDSLQQDCKQRVADLPLTNRNKTCKRIRTSLCWRQVASRPFPDLLQLLRFVPGRLKLHHGYLDISIFIRHINSVSK